MNSCRDCRLWHAHGNRDSSQVNQQVSAAAAGPEHACDLRMLRAVHGVFSALCSGWTLGHAEVLTVCARRSTCCISRGRCWAEGMVHRVAPAVSLGASPFSLLRAAVCLL